MWFLFFICLAFPSIGKGNGSRRCLCFTLLWMIRSQNSSLYSYSWYLTRVALIYNYVCFHMTWQARLLGRVRVEVAKTLSAAGFPIFDNNDPCFVWVQEFPLFLPADETSIKELDEDGEERSVAGCGGQKWQSCHHPFTAPRESDRGLVYTDPGKVIGEHFDLVLNGEEVGGGSIRINDPVLQKYVMSSVLGLTRAGDEMHYFFEALESGCPPHGGIALGLDRLMAIISPYADSIRDVIAFPKSSGCRDLMTGAPSGLDQRTRSLYHLGDESMFHVSPFPGADAKV